MKLRALTTKEVGALIDELRTMADLPAGPDPKALARAKEIRFLIQGQSRQLPTSATKVDEAYRGLEVLLHTHRWRDEVSVDDLRKRIKSACERLPYYEGLAP